ncbi:MAG: nitroreductase, partial [Oscillospiraceae bacterium]
IELMAHAMGLGALFNHYALYSIAAMPQAGEWLGLGGKTPVACLLLGHHKLHYARSAPRRQADVILK